jgi:hypothetical protein
MEPRPLYVLGGAMLASASLFALAHLIPGVIGSVVRDVGGIGLVLATIALATVVVAVTVTHLPALWSALLRPRRDGSGSAERKGRIA